MATPSSILTPLPPSAPALQDGTPKPETTVPKFLKLWETQQNLSTLIQAFPGLGLLYPFQDSPYCQSQALPFLGNPHELINNLKEGTIEKLQITLPEISLKVNGYGYLSIEAGTILSLTEPLVLGKKGEIITGTFTFLKSQPQFIAFGTSIMAVRGLEFDHGQIRVLRGGGDIRPLAFIEKIGITKPVKEKLHLPLTAPLTLEQFLSLADRKKSGSPPLQLESVKESLSFESLQLKASFHFEKPFALVGDGNTWVETSHVGIDTLTTDSESYPEIKISLKEPKIALNQCKDLVAAERINFFITPTLINLVDSSFRGYGELYFRNGIVRIPGKLSKQPTHFQVQSDKPFTFHFDFESGTFQMQFETPPIQVEGKSQELDLDLKLKAGSGNLTQTTSPSAQGEVNLPLELHMEGMVSPVLLLSSDLFCTTRTSFDALLLSANSAFTCQVDDTYVEWWETVPTLEEYQKDPEKYKPRAAINLPHDPSRPLLGTLTLDAGFFNLIATRFDFKTHELHLGRVAGGFDLQVENADEKAFATYVSIFKSKKGFIGLSLTEVDESIRTVLSSVALNNSMFSELKISDANGWVDPENGDMVLEAAAPEKNPYFLETKATGDLSFASSPFHIPLDQASLKIESLNYSRHLNEVIFSGDIFLKSHFIPDEWLGAMPLQIQEAKGGSQEFTIRFHAEEAILNKKGLIIPNNVTISIEALHDSPPPRVASLKNVLTPTLYDHKPSISAKGPLLKPNEGIKELALKLLPALIEQLKAIPAFSIILPHDKGEIGASFFWPRTGNISFDLNTVQKGSRQTIEKMELKTDGPPQSCVGPTVLGECFFEPDLEFKRVHLTTYDAPFRDDSPLAIDASPPREKSGRILFSFNTLTDKSWDFLSSFLGLKPGEIIPSPFPLDFDAAKKELLASWPSLSEKVLESPQKQSGPSLLERLQLRPENMAFNVDLAFKETALEMPATSSGGFQLPRLRLFFNEETHLKLLRHPSLLQQIQVGEFKVAELLLDASTQGKPGSFFWLKGLNLTAGTLLKQAWGYASNLHIQVRETAFSLAQFQGRVSRLDIQNPLFRSAENEAPLLGAEKMSAEALVINPETNVQIGFSTQQFNPFVILHDQLMELGAKRFEAQNIQLFKDGFGLMASALNADEFQGYIPLTQKKKSGALITTQLSEEAPYRFDARHLSIEKGAFILTSTFLALGGEAKADKVAVEVHQDGALFFEAENTDLLIVNSVTDYFKEIPFSEDNNLDNLPFIGPTLLKGLKLAGLGIELHSIELGGLHIKGNFAQSSFDHGDLDLKGDFSLTTEGKINLTYKGLKIQTSVQITLAHITHLALKDKKLNELEFYGAQLNFDGLFAKLIFKDKFRGGIGSKGSQLEIQMPYGHYQRNNAPLNTPIIDFPEIEMVLNTKTRGTLEVKKAKIEVPGDLKLHTHFGVKTKGKRTLITVYDFTSKATLHDIKTTNGQKP